LSSGSINNIPPGVKFLQLDIREAALREVFANGKFEAVVHLAAQTMVPFSIEHPDIDADINVQGLLNVLEACRQYKVKNFLFASSAAVYGDNEQVPLLEESDTQPTSFYGISKMVAEHYLRVYHKLCGLNATVFRFANVYGERQGNGGEGGVVSIFGKLLAAGKGLNVYGDGEQTRDFVYAGDVARALAAGLHSNGYQIINVATNVEVSVNELLATFEQVVGRKLPVSYEPIRTGDIYRSCLDNHKLKRLLGVTPVTTLPVGISKTYQYFINAH
ncbi:MAG: GDP-mannose 4,6-dehydratase, partial [Acidaminococcaceae bacterium]